jgi:hypothetical protein
MAPLFGEVSPKAHDCPRGHRDADQRAAVAERMKRVRADGFGVAAPNPVLAPIRLMVPMYRYEINFRLSRCARVCGWCDLYDAHSPKSSVPLVSYAMGNFSNAHGCPLAVLDSLRDSERVRVLCACIGGSMSRYVDRYQNKTENRAERECNPHLSRRFPIFLEERCSATTKRTRQPRRAPAVRGWAVCRCHGARVGVSTGNRNGRYRHGGCTSTG